MFDNYSITINLLIFAGLAGSIWAAGTRLSYYIDAIAEQTKIARAFMGLIILAVATELPEMVTTLTAASTGNASLALNNMFGGMMLQLAVLAIAEIFVAKGALSSSPRDPTVVVAGLALIPSLSILLILSFTGDIAIAAHMGAGSIIIAVLYIFSMWLLWKSQNRETWSPVDLPNEKKLEEIKTRHNRYDSVQLKKLVIFSIIAALVILFSGVLVVRVAETLADQTGLGSSFIGISLLALTTSMPELSTSIAAVRVRAYTMAISNIFGSNLIMTFLLFPVDLFFLEGPVVNHIDLSASIALAAGILLTTIYCIGLLIRAKKKILGMNIDSSFVLIGYIISLAILYHVR